MVFWGFWAGFRAFYWVFGLFILSGYTIFNQKMLAIWLVICFLFGEFYTGGCYLSSLVLLWLSTIKEKGRNK